MSLCVRCSCVVSTAPERVGNGWDQGVFFLPPMAVTQGAHLTCHVEAESAIEGQGSGQLRFEVITAAGQGAQAQPAFAMGEEGKGHGRSVCGSPGLRRKNRGVCVCE